MNRRPAARCRGPLTTAEEGVALITVIGLSFVLMLAITAATAYAVNTMPQVRDHEDWNAALAAAEAGVDDALYQLTQNANYWASPDPGNEARSGWRDMPGLASDARYHYRLDASQVGRTGAVDVTSTGWVGDQRRTIEVRLRREGFLDNIYFTDIESSDPFALTADAAQRTYLDTYCDEYHPDRDTRDVSTAVGSGGCGTIRFAPGDVLDGPTRSNDALLIRSGTVGGQPGPRFLGRVWTGWNFETAGATRPYLRDGGSVGEPHFQDGISYRPRIRMPETSQRMADQASATGCRYEGPTYLRFHVSGSQSRMTVVSPLTDPSSVNQGCGTGSPPNGTPSGGINATVALKDGEVLYVRDSDRAGVSAHPLGMPRPSDNVSTYSPTAGDVFVYGELDGQVTVAAQNDVVIVWDLTYRDPSPDSTDLLGLIADNNVWVYHPVQRTWSGYTNLNVAHRHLPPFSADPTNPFTTNGRQWQDPEIHAAILALNRSFGVQAFNRGAPFPGDLTVHGAIAQKWRGPVATAGSGTSIGSGYLKDYVYDPRLQFLTPPYFLEPELAPWDRRRWAEVDVPPVCEGAETPEEDGCRPPG